MSVMKRFYRSRRNQIVILAIIIISILYYISLNDELNTKVDLDLTRSSFLSHSHTTSKPVAKPKALKPKVNKQPVKPKSIHLNVVNRNSVIEYIETRLQEALKQDKGTGCEIPKLDPFAQEVTKFDKVLPEVECSGQDWVRCYLSECRVVDEILETYNDIICSYYDILYESDQKYTIGTPTEVHGSHPYTLTRSDHVKIKCSGKGINSTTVEGDSILRSKWTGHSLGFRNTVKPKTPPEGREDSLNVLILGFDSTAKNGFIRRMPRSYKVLLEEFKATVLNGYNIVGDGTPAALFPILTGKTELELPDVRKRLKRNGTLDSMPFIFYKLKEDGYRTAYFEDMPWIGTFQYRFNGFQHQPADHYLRAFYLEESGSGSRWWKGKMDKYCVGDTPRYKIMLNITDQFLKLDGKRFCFTFIADITHDDFNMISTADDELVHFLRQFKGSGRMEDTLLLVMGDHGPRYADVRDTLQGKLEERLPLMSIVLPEALKRDRPDVQAILESNANVLTNPHDIYATVLDVIGMTKYWNNYKVAGADLTRGMTLLEPVPANRSCSEAGIEPHWCACLSWQNVSSVSPMYHRTVMALVDYINSLTEPVRSLCSVRTLKSVSWVMQQRANSRMMSFVAARDHDGYVGKFGANVRLERIHFQVKIAVGPGRGVYEASMTYLVNEDKFAIDSRDISRTNAYGNEPSCISATHPHLNMYCYCNG